MPRAPTKPRTKKAKAAVATGVSDKKRSEAAAAVVASTGYAVGHSIFHPMFGEGKVMAVEADILTIKFNDGRVKRIVDFYVKRRER